MLSAVIVGLVVGKGIDFELGNEDGNALGGGDGDEDGVALGHIEGAVVVGAAVPVVSRTSWIADAGTFPRLPVERSVHSAQSPSDAWRMTTLPGLSESWPSA